MKRLPDQQKNIGISCFEHRGKFESGISNKVPSIGRPIKKPFGFFESFRTEDRPLQAPMVLSSKIS